MDFQDFINSLENLTKSIFNEKEKNNFFENFNELALRLLDGLEKDKK